MALRFNRQYNIGRAIRNLMTAILSLYVGGVMLSAFGSAMVNTSSSLYSGLSLIGWTVGSTGAFNATAYYLCQPNAVVATQFSATAIPNCITGTAGGAVLSVLGIASIAQVVLEFVKF